MKCKNCNCGIIERVIKASNFKNKWVHYKSIYNFPYSKCKKHGCQNPEPLGVLK